MSYGEPVPNMEMFIISDATPGSGNFYMNNGHTDEQGYFNISRIPPGNYKALPLQ